MIVTEIRCEFCTRAEEAEGAKQRGWGQLTSLGAGTKDVCATCISKLGGWQGGAVRGRNPLRLAPRRIHDVETAAL